MVMVPAEVPVVVPPLAFPEATPLMVSVPVDDPGLIWLPDAAPDMDRDAALVPISP